MATVFKRKYDTGGVVWNANFTVRGKRYRERLEAQNKEQAKKMARKLEEDVINEKFDLVDKHKEVTLEELCEQYINFVKDLKRSWKRDVVSLKNVLNMLIDNKRFSEYYISNITPFHIQKYQIQRKREVEANYDRKGIQKEDWNLASVNRELSCLKHMFYLAMEWEMIGKNPVVSKSIKYFPEKQRERLLTEEEMINLLNACNDKVKTIVLIALNCGLRKSEILNLKWKNVDLISRKIYITLTKTDKDRFVPVNNFLFNIVNSLPRESEYVFPGRTPSKPTVCFKKSFRNSVEEAGITGFRFHDLRHQFCSLLAMNGVDETTIGELVGHSKKTITSRYSHSTWQKKVEAVEKIGELCHRYVTVGEMAQNSTQRKSLKINNGYG